MTTRRHPAIALTLLALCAAGSAVLAQSLAASPAVLFEGARIIVDARRPPIEDGALLIEGGRVVRVGKRGQVTAPRGATRVNVSGKTIMPALVDAHVHLGYQKRLEFSAANFTRETVLDQLHAYASSGVGVVASLGTDLGDMPFEVRRAQESGALGGALWLTAGRGIGAAGGGPGAAELKPSAYGVTTEDEVRRAVREQIARHVDVVKIWVDDRGKTVPSLSPALYAAAIDEAHRLGARIVAHVFYLADAKGLLRAGIDGFAHLVRDAEMDDEVIALITQRNVYVMPNLAISANATYSAAPAWLADPLLLSTAPAEVIARVRATFASRTPETVARAAQTYRTMQRSLAKLNAAGVRLVLGSDDGAVRDHFYAFTPVRELQLMAEAGMTPAQVLTAATVTSSEFLHLPDHGTLDAGKSADLVVLDANPLANVANATKISAVYIRGVKVARP